MRGFRIFKTWVLLRLILQQLLITLSATAFLLGSKLDNRVALWGQWARSLPGRADTGAAICCRRQVTAVNSVSSTSVVDDIATIKNSLLQMSAITERGQLATAAQRDDIRGLVYQLEQLREEGRAPRSSDMVGTWTLVYSSSQAFRSSPFFSTFQALLGREDIAERIFAFTDGFPNARIGQARQIVNDDCTELVSRVDMSIWPYSWISGVVETRATILNEDVCKRIEVVVDSTRVRDSVLAKLDPRLESWSVPIDRLSERIFDRIPRITLETLFLNDDLRVSRLPDGNFLVYVKDY